MGDHTASPAITGGIKETEAAGARRPELNHDRRSFGKYLLARSEPKLSFHRTSP